MVREQERPQTQCLAQDRMIILAAQDGRYPLPSPVLIETHYLIARIIHTAGVERLFIKYYEFTMHFLNLLEMELPIELDSCRSLLQGLNFRIRLLCSVRARDLGDDKKDVRSGAADARSVGGGLWREMIVEQPFDDEFSV